MYCVVLSNITVREYGLFEDQAHSLTFAEKTPLFSSPAMQITCFKEKSTIIKLYFDTINHISQRIHGISMSKGQLDTQIGKR